MKKMIVLVLASFSLSKAMDEKPMMGSYMTPNGGYSNPTSRLVDKVFTQTELGSAKKEIIGSFMNLKQELQKALKTNPELIAQFKKIASSEDLKMFVQHLPQEKQEIILGLIQKMHGKAATLIANLKNMRDSLMGSGVRLNSKN